MATPAQIQANRRNAQRSSGPRTQEGKAASRFNALKHGADAHFLVIPGEDPAELEALALEYHRRFRPDGPLEAFFVETLVKADWDRRRYARIEAQYLRVQLAAVAPGPGGAPLPAVGAPEYPTDAPLGVVFHNDAQQGNVLEKLFRRQSAAERTYFRALAELRRAQRERMEEESYDDTPPAGPAGAAFIARDPTGDPLESTPIGFVPPNPAWSGPPACHAAIRGGICAQPNWTTRDGAARKDHAGQNAGRAV